MDKYIKFKKEDLCFSTLISDDRYHKVIEENETGYKILDHQKRLIYFDKDYFEEPVFLIDANKILTWFKGQSYNLNTYGMLPVSKIIRAIESGEFSI